MKRSAPIKRRTAIKRSGPIKKHPPKRRGSPPALAFGKETVVHDPAWLERLRGERCCHCGRRPRNHAHHTKHRGIGGATQRDDLSIPVCVVCHGAAHGAPQAVTANGKPATFTISRQWQELEAERWRARYLQWKEQSEYEETVPR